MSRSWRIAMVLLTFAGLLHPAGGVAAPPENTAPQQKAAQQLAETYAPITMLREEVDPPCEKTAEQYEPTGVGTVLGNPTVTLTREGPDKGLDNVMKAPAASD